ncbi:MAG: hypothetical protein HYS62_03110 [Candidatus Aenigmarchaeota archaeon]|nr:hypothetical protein [Candidatus Aenigmarchaeota archaeon]
MVLQRIFGWLLVFAGLFFIIALPGIMSGPGKYGGSGGGYMPGEFAHTIVLIGLVLLGVGIFLLVKS